MVLNAVKLLFCALVCRNRAVSSVGSDFEVRSDFGNIVEVAHPADCLRRNALENLRTCFVNDNLCFAIFAHRGLLNLSSQQVLHKLCAVA